MKHIVAFSGGLASAVAAKIIADKHPDDTILLYHATNTEPPDNDRFRVEVANYIGLPITEDSDGRNIWQLFKDVKYLGNNRRDPCSRIMKRERSLKYVKNIQEKWSKKYYGYGRGSAEWGDIEGYYDEPDKDEIRERSCILYYGFTYGSTPKEHEGDRAQRVFARYLADGINTAFPLLEQKITKDECEHRVVECWGIEKPQMYAWAEHANCVPCVKGKKAYWGLINMFHRTAWVKAVEAERVHGHTIFTQAGSLQEEEENCLRLAKKYLDKKKQKNEQNSLFDYPCECAV